MLGRKRKEKKNMLKVDKVLNFTQFFTNTLRKRPLMVALHSFPTSSSVFGEKNARRAKKYDEDQFNFQGINYGRILSLIIFLRCLLEKKSQTRKRKRDSDHQAFLTASSLVSVFHIKTTHKKKCSEESCYAERPWFYLLLFFSSKNATHMEFL